MILMMTSAQDVETSVTTTDNGPSQDYAHPDDQTTLLNVIFLSQINVVSVSEEMWKKILSLKRKYFAV